MINNLINVVSNICKGARCLYNVRPIIRPITERMNCLLEKLKNILLLYNIKGCVKAFFPKAQIEVEEHFTYYRLVVIITD